MVVCLEGDLELKATVGGAELAAPEAGGLDGVEALLVLDLGALLHAGGGAHGVGRGTAHGSVPGDLNLIELGDSVGDGGAVRALVDGDGHRAGDELQGAVLPGDVNAVLVAGPDLLALFVDDPLGVALLLGDLFADGGLVVLDEGLNSGLVALLGHEGVAACGVIVVEPGEGGGAAVGVPNHLAIRHGDGHTSRAELLGAGLLGPVGADGGDGDVVLDRAVPGDIDAVVLVTVTMVISAGEPRHQDQTGDEDERLHCDLSDY